MSKVKKKKKPTPWPTYDVGFDIDELKEKRIIDKYALDDMVTEQPELFGEVADAAATAKSIVESLVEELKELDADLDKKIREEFSEERITEKEISAKIARNSKRKKLVIRQLEAQHVYRRLDALTTTFRHRAYAIRDCVDLYLADYYNSRSTGGSKSDKRDHDVEDIIGKQAEQRDKRGGERKTKGVSRRRKRSGT